ncbi:MAG: aminotransferase class I/II-fold pyridoxal phosphate-dependent enzyme [Opitutales bacterium]|nr:aminotransferase class I/II-fold pyridoxal phosphate-dependent enzyme [Opitutales bacterium]
MAFFQTLGKANPIVRRALEDPITKERLRYAPFYLPFEKQKGSRVWLNGHEMVMLASNEYLGLSEHPKIIEAGKKAFDQWGSSTTGARISNGSRACHVEIEQKVAQFLGKEDCHVSSAGYISCMSALATFAQRGDLILADKNIHSSLVTGMRLSDARIERFIHNNPGDLQEILATEKPETAKIITFDGIYSMEGHLAPVPELVQLAKTYDCFTVMDDAHGFGVMGPQGRGTAAHYGCTDDIDIISGSFSKALSSIGGFVAGSKPLIEYLRTHSKQTIFSAAITPSQAACASTALDLLQSEPEHLERLWKNTRRMKDLFNRLKLNTWGSETPAIPVVIGNLESAFRFWKALLEKGVFTVLSVSPAVPPGKDLIRTAASARHTDEDFEIIEAAFEYAASQL